MNDSRRAVMAGHPLAERAARGLFGRRVRWLTAAEVDDLASILLESAVRHERRQQRADQFRQAMRSMPPAVAARREISRGAPS